MRLSSRAMCATKLCSWQFRGRAQTECFLNAYLDQLTAPRQELIKLTGVRVLDRSHRRPDGAGEGRQDGGVNRVGLRQLSRRLGEIARLDGD